MISLDQLNNEPATSILGLEDNHNFDAELHKKVEIEDSIVKSELDEFGL